MEHVALMRQTSAGVVSTLNTLSVSAGNDKFDSPHYGQKLRIRHVTVKWDAAIGVASTHSITLNSGKGSNYDIVLWTESVNSVQYWAWGPANCVVGNSEISIDLVLMPKDEQGGADCDALDISVGSVTGRISYIACYYEVLD